MRAAPRATTRRAAAWTAAAPLVWTFDGVFATCLADAEDALRRAIVQLGEVSGIAVALDLSLPALLARVRAGDLVQPAWSRFVRALSHDYGLPSPPRVRHRRQSGPLLMLVILYRS
jgi:hypothetical protein